MTIRTFTLAVLLTILASYWIDMAEVTGGFCQITEAVPSIPAVAFLIALVLLVPLVRRLSHRIGLTRQEVLVVYVFLLVSTTMAACGVVRYWINTIPALSYFDNPENGFAVYQSHLPEWMVPQDKEAVRQFYEGSESGHIPWRPWLVPITAWGLFFLAFWTAMLCMAAAFRRQWCEKERLPYPLLYLPMDLTADMDTPGMAASFFTNPIMWVGFGVAVIYNVTNMIHAYNPAFVALGQSYSLGTLPIIYRPEIVGFGYLVNIDVAFSVWACYLLQSLYGWLAHMIGVQIPGLPFVREQSFGGYLAMAILLIWVARHQLKEVLAKSPWLTFGGMGAFLVTVGWMMAAGMAPWLSVTYTVLLLMTALVYARIRADVGVPLVWMFPFLQHHQAIKYFLGSDALLYKGSWASGTVFTTMVILSRGFFTSLMAYQVEGFKLAQDVDIKQRSMGWTLVLAMVAGFGVAVWLHLRSYYVYGSGGMALEGWGAEIARYEYGQLASYAQAAVPPDIHLITAVGAGFVQILIISGLRMIFTRFPLHPIGFCMATSYGGTVWSSFLLVWLIKTVVLKVAGMRGYHKLIPGFIGLALGHFFTAGIAYGLVGTYGGEAYQQYIVHFG